MRFLALVCIAGCSQVFGLDPPDRRPASDALTGDVQTDALDTAWWDTSWARRRQITIDTQNLSGSITSFPVLVRLARGTIPEAASNGADIRFVDGAGDQTLPFEVETFDNASGVFWVKVPSLVPGTSYAMWAYYGNPAATSASDPAGVFGAEHTSVHHLDGFEDATGHGHVASVTGSSSIPAAVSGIVGNARSFDGTDDYVTLADESAFDFTAGIYVSVWFKVTAFTTNYQALVAKADSSWRVHRADGSNVLGFGVTQSGIQYNLTSVSNVSDNAWHHVAVVGDANGRSIYVDGQLEATAAGAVNLATNDYSVAFGRNETGTNGPRYWNGSIDEVRISSTPRSAVWIAAEFQMVTDPSTVTIGPAEPAPQL